MSRGLIAVFLLMDVIGVLWCVRTLVREALRQLAVRREERYVPPLPMLELPADFVLEPAGWPPRPRPPVEDKSTATPARLVS